MDEYELGEEVMNKIKIKGSSMKMWLTERDMRLMDWINRIGFVTVEHVAKWLSVAVPTAYIRLKKLVSNGYLIHERIFHGVPGIYRLTLKGKYISSSSLPPLRRIRIGTYHHDLAVVDLSFVLLARYGGEFIYERDLRQDSEYEIGKSGHISDGMLLCGDKKIFIEVELTCKGKQRLRKIFNHHMRQFGCETWYFCGSDAVERHIKAEMCDVDFIKIYSLSAFQDLHCRQ